MSDCGDCTVCCSLFAIKELDKSRHEDCSHCTGTGCGIYDTRPQTCRDYKCFFISENLSEEARPDRCGMLLDYNKKKGRIEALRIGLVLDALAVKEAIDKVKRKYKQEIFGIDARPKEAIR